MPTEDAKLLDDLHNCIRKCKRCDELVANRTKVVPGAGNPNAQIMFIGEAPGADEDMQGLPFVGQAGKLLDKLLEQAGIPRETVFIGNVLKCRPPNNRDPLDNEIANCREYLHAQISLIHPRLICTLGNPSLKTLVDKNLTIGKVHGTVLEKNGLKFFPIYHPAASLHNPGLRVSLVDDFKKLSEYLRK